MLRVAVQIELDYYMEKHLAIHIKRSRLEIFVKQDKIIHYKFIGY